MVDLASTSSVAFSATVPQDILALGAKEVRKVLLALSRTTPDDILTESSVIEIGQFWDKGSRMLSIRCYMYKRVHLIY